ncbi:hypothetical protein [Clostridium facile]|uniref:Uncharacterized protein n=1 Tax=Clostridium facile TaxID=2763035 RepID=A0ABR7IQV7_9CLOT|nr:hypothetical protein [Clostridium facile]MBC5787508.1 hypothetical protein [Clostridium facile]
MKISENQKNYIPLIIPIDKPYEKLSPSEAKSYFDWFVDHIDERSEYIKQKVSKDLNIPIETLNFSMESLIYIWRWFLKVAELTKTPKNVLKELQKEMKANGEPDEFIEDMVREHSLELSIFSHYVIRDIGMYVGKMFITNFCTLRWDYHTNIEQDSFANIPQIFGFVDSTYNPPFEMQFDPIHFTEMQASNLFDNTQNENDLYNVCKLWTQWIPNSKIKKT